jgi:peptide/nickel transport system ATP-binding protein
MSALRFEDVSVRYGAGRHAVDACLGVDLEVPGDSVLGLVGESGSGKSTLARAAVGLVPLCRGRVLLDGEDLSAHRHGGRSRARAPVQMVFQDPTASLNPRMTIADTIDEALATVTRTSRPARRHRGLQMLDLVGLTARHLHVYPRELSGGQRQRVAIARALAAEPRVLVADEITSALDASIQGSILNLLRDLRAQLGISILFISHDLSVVRFVSDRIAVMYLGRIVEEAAATDLLDEPQHPYTRALIGAVPTLSSRAGDTGLVLLDEDPPDPHAPPPGCSFHPRCPRGPRKHPDRTACLEDDPASAAQERPHRAACHFPAGEPC